MCDDTSVVGNDVFLPTVERNESRKGTFACKLGVADVVQALLAVIEAAVMN